MGRPQRKLGLTIDNLAAVRSDRGEALPRSCRHFRTRSWRAEVEDAVRDARLQRQGEPRRRRHLAELLALKKLTAAEEARIGALVKKAVS